jgi:hypothetical protein
MFTFGTAKSGFFGVLPFRRFVKSLLLHRLQILVRIGPQIAILAVAAAAEM